MREKRASEGGVDAAPAPAHEPTERSDDGLMAGRERPAQDPDPPADGGPPRWASLPDAPMMPTHSPAPSGRRVDPASGSAVATPATAPFALFQFQHLAPMIDDAVDQFERVPLAAVDDQQRRRDELADFLQRFNFHKETLLRSALDEVAWHLERRGHHAWVVEPQGDVALPEGRVGKPADYRIALHVLPAGYRAGIDSPSKLLFEPVHELLRVHVTEHVENGAGGMSTDFVVGDFQIDELDAGEVFARASELVRRAFLNYKRLPSSEYDDPSIAHD